MPLALGAGLLLFNKSICVSTLIRPCSFPTKFQDCTRRSSPKAHISSPQETFRSALIFGWGWYSYAAPSAFES